MKAIVYEQFGPPDVLHLKEVDKPVPGDDEVLVKVHAASINFGDVSFVKGKPFLVRLMGAGLTKPQYPILGSDLAGTVEAVGKNVTRFKPGDAVYGDASADGWGGFAEYDAVPENILAPKPANLSFEEAATVPQAAVVALQGLRDKGHIQAGQKVLINGASGGTGTFAVQIAKSFGAEVTGVCSTRNLELVQSLGADHVIDYTKTDFVKDSPGYDLIIAMAGYRPIFDYRRALAPGGTYVMSGGAMAQIFQAMLLGPVLSMAGDKKLCNLMAMPDRNDLATVTGLIEAGQVTPVIDQRFPLEAVADAIRYYEKGRTRGKLVITITP